MVIGFNPNHKEFFHYLQERTSAGEKIENEQDLISLMGSYNEGCKTNISYETGLFDQLQDAVSSDGAGISAYDLTFAISDIANERRTQNTMDLIDKAFTPKINYLKAKVQSAKIEVGIAKNNLTVSKNNLKIEAYKKRIAEIEQLLAETQRRTDISPSNDSPE